MPGAWREAWGPLPAEELPWDKLELLAAPPRSPSSAGLSRRPPCRVHVTGADVEGAAEKRCGSDEGRMRQCLRESGGTRRGCWVPALPGELALPLPSSAGAQRSLPGHAQEGPAPKTPEPGELPGMAASCLFNVSNK